MDEVDGSVFNHYNTILLGNSNNNLLKELCQCKNCTLHKRTRPIQFMLGRVKGSVIFWRGQV